MLLGNIWLLLSMDVYRTNKPTCSYLHHTKQRPLAVESDRSKSGLASLDRKRFVRRFGRPVMTCLSKQLRPARKAKASFSKVRATQPGISMRLPGPYFAASKQPTMTIPTNRSTSILLECCKEGVPDFERNIYKSPSISCLPRLLRKLCICSLPLAAVHSPLPN